MNDIGLFILSVLPFAIIALFIAGVASYGDSLQDSARKSREFNWQRERDIATGAWDEERRYARIMSDFKSSGLEDNYWRSEYERKWMY